MNEFNKGAKFVKDEIDQIIIELITADLSINQHFTSIKKVGNNTVVSWGQAKDLSIVMKNVEYSDIYKALHDDGNYNIKLVDGSLIQMMYKFDKEDKLLSHRLGFFPSIYLESFSKDPEVYEKHDLYADILKKNTLPTIFRFDFDDSPDLYVELDHAKSHVTFGQFENCRIPASGPVNPRKFMDFVFRYFYHKAMKHHNLDFHCKANFDKTISIKEAELIHFNFN